MCGIAGILSFSGAPVIAETLIQFIDSMAHRGPDGRGSWINEKRNIGLAHRRLSILDLSDAASQPFHSADGRYVLTYNGEIFNFTEIRKELEAKGHAFQTQSDTEVLLNAWIEWGKDCLSKFNGMWAFAIWDEKEQKLFLCRDRFGVKPLYYLWEEGRMLAFASETYAFKHLAGFTREPDPVLLNLAMQRVFALEGTGRTPFRNIQSLSPGHFMEVSPQGKKSVHVWWNTREAITTDIPDSYEACVEYLRYLLDDACRIRMRSDVPLATALSGGIDSSAVYASVFHVHQQAAGNQDRTATNWQYAFTASFPGAPTDETRYAHRVASHIGGSLIEVNESPEDLLKNMIADTVKFDSIYLSPVNVASSLYSAMYTQGIRVSLDGHGVDEMMYGYGHMVADAWKEEYLRGNTEYAQDLAATYAALFPPEQYNWAESSLHQRLHEQSQPAAVRGGFRQLYDNLVPDAIKKVYRSLRNSPEPAPAWLKPVSMEFPEQAFVQNFPESGLYTEFHTSTLPTLLRNFDRASMLAGIESRMPFMDYRLVSFMFSLPREYKVGQGYTKRILRDVIRPRLPAEIVNRTWKVGFNAPMPDWFAGPLRGWLEDTVHSRSFRESPWWNAKAIIKTVEDKQKSNTWGQEECMTLWPVLSAHLILNKT